MKIANGKPSMDFKFFVVFIDLFEEEKVEKPIPLAITSFEIDIQCVVFFRKFVINISADMVVV